MAMYNKFITFLLLTFMVSISFAQQYTPMTAAGYQYKRAKVDSTLHIPSFCGVPNLRNSTAIQGALAMDTCANKLYQWTHTAGWSTISTNAIDSLKRSNDSIFARKSGVWVFQYKDSVGGGGSTPSLQDVATVGNTYDNGYATIELNKEVAGNSSNYPYYFYGNEGIENRISYIGFENDDVKLKVEQTGGFGKGININSKSINLYNNDLISSIDLDTSGLKIVKLSNGQSAKLAFHTNTPYVTDYIAYMPVGSNYSTDTLSTLKNIRENTIDTSNKFVNNIYRTSGVDSIYYKIGSTTYAIKDSVGNAGGGGGGGKIYYFNGSVNLGTFGGITMYELGDTAITGTAANFTRSTTGNIANFITDVNKPGLLQIPAGVWTIDAFLSETGGGSNHAQIYALLEKWNGSTITTIATSPVEEITNGSSIDLYTYAISVPTTTISATDRIIIQFYIQNTNGKTVTLYTQNGYVGEVHTTFTTGIGALNGLTASTQTFATGTSGTDFNISSATSTHTFNLPTASATNRGALSSANWSTFNSKLGASDTVSLSNRINLKVNISDTATMLTPYLRKIDTTSLSNRINLKVNIADTATMLSKYLRKTDTASLSSRIDLRVKYTDTATMLTPYLRSNTASATYLAKSDSTIYYTKYRSDTSRTNIYNALLGKQGTITLTTTGTSGASTLVGNTLNIPQYSGGTSYTFSTGLTNSSGTVTNNLSTGVSGGQSVVGGTAASNSLTLSSTTNATKGKILFGTSAYDEVNNRLGIGTASPTSLIQSTGSITASSLNAKGVNLTSTLVATANSDTLTGLDVNTTYTNGAFSGVQNYMQKWSINGVVKSYMRVYGQTWLIGDGTTEAGKIEYTTPSGFPGILTQTYSAGSYVNRFDLINRGSSFRLGFDASNGGNGNLGIFNTGNVVISTSGMTDAGYKLDVNGTARANQFQLSALNTAPATSTSTGTTGEIRIVNGFIYVCVATNTWQRATLSTF